MEKIRVAINGFGRIGRQTCNIALNFPELEIVAINDLTDTKTLAHLFKYDSVYGCYEGEIKTEGDFLIINNKKIRVFVEKDPSLLPWKDLDIDVVVESTGVFTEYEKANLHLKAGAKKVIISAPSSSEEVKTFVLGVNEKTYNNKEDNIISMASCTTNCLAPVIKVLNENFKIKYGLTTTAHSYTNDQRLLDLPHKDLRRARAANLSIIPTSTGAAKAVEKVIPELKGKLDALALRIPMPIISVCDIIVEVEKKTAREEVNNTFKKTAQNELRGILSYIEEPLVSIDFRKDTHSAIIDGLLTNVLGNLIKVIAWYDNEWGYSQRLVEFVKYIGEKIKK